MHANSFKDHFSAIAGAYAAARPDYPDALYAQLAQHVPAQARVWEPGCGSGQATRGLAERFAEVHASDPSVQQLQQHWAHDASLRGQGRVRLSVAPGERCDLDEGSVGLVAVAQALHWFERPLFFAQCQRVLAPGGVLAAWCYGDVIAPEGMENALADFNAQIEGHWLRENHEVRAGYADYQWPFPALAVEPLWLQARWGLGRFLGFLNSLSASERCRSVTGEDPVAIHRPALSRAWGAAGDERELRWPLFLHLRRKPD